MRRIVVIIIGAFALAGCGTDTAGQAAGTQPAVEPAANAARTVASTPSTTPTATPAPTPAGLAVVEVVDGDTIKVDEGGTTVTVRVIGLDTPETKDPRKPVQCFGPEASAHAHELLDGASVRLETDPSQGRIDRYGRTLAYVWLPDGQLFEEQMIAGGYGREYTYDTAYKYRSRFKAAQADAKAGHAGLWKACVSTPTPVPKPRPVASKPAPKLDPQFRTCGQANDAGYGPYTRGVDPEYDWYQDRDHDGVVCES